MLVLVIFEDRVKKWKRDISVHPWYFGKAWNGLSWNMMKGFHYQILNLRELAGRKISPSLPQHRFIVAMS
jgi:hypothetical protein